MLPYWLLFSLFAFGSLQYQRRGAIGEQPAPILMAGGLVIALMIGFRYKVGGDWNVYLDIYDSIATMDFRRALVAQDPGYGLLNYIAAAMGVGVWFVNLVCGLIFSWGLIKFARRQPNPWLAVVVAIPYLVIVVAMGYTRQGVAIGIILAGLSVLDRSSIYRFAVYIVFAATFHKSAVIVLPLVGLAAARQRLAVAALLAVLGVVLYYFLIQATFDRMVSNYVESEYNSQGAAIRVAMNLPPAVLFMLYQKRFGLTEQQKKLWRNFAIASFVTLLLLMRTTATTAVDRLALYLIPLQIFVFARLPDVFRDRGRSNGQVLLLILLYSAAIQFVWLTFAAHAEFWVPYQFWPVGEIGQARGGVEY